MIYNDSRSPLSGQPDHATNTEYRHLQRFFDNLPCTVYQSRNEAGWPIEFISEHCRELTGYDPNAFIVGGVSFGFDLIHPEDREHVSQAVSESVQNEESFSIQYRILTADNKEKHVRELGVGLVDEDMEPTPIVGAIIDEAVLPTDQWDSAELTDTDIASHPGTD